MSTAQSGEPEVLLETPSESAEAYEAPGPSQTPKSPNRGFLRRIWKSNQVRLGALLVALTVLVALIGPFLAPFSPTSTVGSTFQAPDGSLLLGGDMIGRDVLSRVLHGGINLIWMAPLATLIGVSLGAAVGLISAYFGGGADAVLMRAIDVLLAFPGIILALMIVGVLGSSPATLVAVAALSLLPGVARVVRGAVIPLNAKEYVLWARAVGLPSRKILWGELLPNIISPLMVEFGVRLMWCIGILATLSFLGYGIEPPAPDWGRMVSENRNGMGIQPWAVIAPITMLILFTVGGNLIAEGIARVIARTEGKK